MKDRLVRIGIMIHRKKYPESHCIILELLLLSEKWSVREMDDARKLLAERSARYRWRGLTNHGDRNSTSLPETLTRHDKHLVWL